MKTTFILLLSAFAAGGAFAQGEGNKDPANPDAAVPPISYRSAFEGYRPYREQDLISWQEVNDEVGRVGGHIGVLKAKGAREESKPAAGHRHQHGERR